MHTIIGKYWHPNLDQLYTDVCIRGLNEGTDSNKILEVTYFEHLQTSCENYKWINNLCVTFRLMKI